jgi:hypothetical protein
MYAVNLVTIDKRFVCVHVCNTSRQVSTILRWAAVAAPLMDVCVTDVGTGKIRIYARGARRRG